MTEDLLRVARMMVDQDMFDYNFYASQTSSALPTDPVLSAVHYLQVGEKQGLAPCGLFDPLYYVMVNDDVAGTDCLVLHYLEHGRAEGRASSFASALMALDLDQAAIEEGVIPPPGASRHAPGYPGALAASLRAIDNDPRYFSSVFYRERYPDIQGTATDALIHYLRYGRHEGRVTNVKLIDDIFINVEAIDPNLPFAMIGVHEASKTGAPIVGMDLARVMQSEYNIVFVSLRDGPLLEEARTLYPVVAVVSQIEIDTACTIDYLTGTFKIENAIFSSSACLPIIRPLSLHNCRITCLVHEFLEYMFPFRGIIHLSDLLVFSSRELLKSWQYMLDDLERDPATVLVLPQPASVANARKMSKAEARAAVTETTGIDLDDATLVVGAGQIQIRKGTDIFLQIGNQLAREKGKFVSIWIGEPISEFELAFGVWFHAQIERSRDAEGKLAVHFEPAGPLYPVLMDAADVFLVTSRLDPLPNVALDAAARDIPVISFAGATGLADIAEQGDMDLIEVQIAAVDEVIAAIKSRVGPQSESQESDRADQVLCS